MAARRPELVRRAPVPPAQIRRAGTLILSVPRPYPGAIATRQEGGSVSGRMARRRVLRITLPGSDRPGSTTARADLLAGEEPLGIRVDGTALTMTMRTPGDDIELAAGFLVGEAIVASAG